MAFPTTSTLTTFTQADGALDSNWTVDIFGTGVGQVTVAGNQVVVGTFGRSAWWDTTSFGADSEVFATVAVKPANGAGWLQLFARIQTPGSSAGDAYKVELGPAAGTDAVDVYRVINGVDTQVGSSISQEFTAGDRLGMEVLGTGATVTINVYRHDGASWSLIGSVSDTNAARIVSGGFIGLGGYQTADTMRIDDFGGGTVVAGGTDATVTAVPAIALASAPLGVITAAGDATVTAVPATAAADSPAGVIVAGATVAGVLSDAAASAPPANQMISSVVNAPAVVALASAPLATVNAAGDATVSGVPATALGSAPVATVSAGSAVTGVVSDAAGAAPAGVLAAGAVVAGAVSDAVAQVPRPSISPTPEGGGDLVSLTTTFAEDFA